MANYNPDQVATLATSLLQHHNLVIEPHHVRKAVAAARMIVDEVATELAALEAVPAQDAGAE